MSTRTIEAVFAANKTWVASMQKPANDKRGRDFTKQYGVRTLALCCADGRIPTGSELFELMPTVITMVRTPGAMFRLGWPMFAQTLEHKLRKASKSHALLLTPCISHYSKRGETHNCAACGYDRGLAFKHAVSIYDELLQCHNEGSAEVYPLLCELETDDGEVTIWNADRSDSLSARQASAMSKQEALPVIKNLIDSTFPDRLHEAVLRLLLGNARHIASRLKEGIVLNEHDESILAVGLDYHFLPTSWALRVSPFRPDLDQTIAPLCGVLYGSLKKRQERGISLHDVPPLLMVTLPTLFEIGEPFMTQAQIRFLKDGVLRIMQVSPLTELLGNDLCDLKVLTATVSPNGLLVPFE